MYKFILGYGIIKRTSYLTIYVYLSSIAESSLIYLSCVLHDIKTLNVSNSCDIKSFIYQIDQRLTNFFCKGPDNKYFRVCRSYSLCHSYSALPLYSETSIDNKQTNEHKCIPNKLYLWTLTFEFYIILCATKYYSIFFQPFKIIELFLVHSHTKSRRLGLACRLLFADPW